MKLEENRFIVSACEAINIYFDIVIDYLAYIEFNNLVTLNI